MKNSGRGSMIFLALATLLTVGTFSATAYAAGKEDKAEKSDKGKSHGDDLSAEGAFTCDFGLKNDLNFADVPAILEKDRVNQSARPGFVRKLVPLLWDPLESTCRHASLSIL